MRSLMHVSNRGLALIRRHEGFFPHPYRCPAGYLTVGYGHMIRGGENFAAGISESQAETLLKKDIRMAEDAVRRLIVIPLTQNQFDALASFTFNLGGGALQRSTLRRKINRGEHAEIGAEFMKWVWAGGRKLSGLIRRRAEESALYLSVL